MQIYINLDTRQLIKSDSDPSPVSQLEMKRGDQIEMEIRFVSANAVVEIPAGSIVSFGAKVIDDFSGPALVFEDGFALVGSGASARYVATPDYQTEPLNDALNPEAPALPLRQVDLMGEVTWRSGADGPIASTANFNIRVYNDVIRGDEDTPAALPDPDEWVKKTDAAIIRPFNLGDPNLPLSMTITGELTNGTDPVVFPVLKKVSIFEGRPIYQSDDIIHICNWNNFEWMLSRDGEPLVEYFSTGDVTLPSLADWGGSAETPATGTPIVTAGPPLQGAFIGQQLRWEQATAGSYKWYIWNGTAWSELALA
jgi:hypothetical protein